MSFGKTQNSQNSRNFSSFGRGSSPSSIAARNNKRKMRTRFSTLVNLFVLVALFSAVFALQNIGKQTNRAKNVPAAEENQNADIQVKEDVNEIQSVTVRTSVDTTSLAPESEVEVTAEKIQPVYAPEQKIVKRVRHIASKNTIATEDRARSAELVDMLDGKRQNGSYNVSPVTKPAFGSYSQPSVYKTSYNQGTPYRSDLDDETARTHYLRTSGLVSADNSDLNSSYTQNAPQSYAYAPKPAVKKADPETIVSSGSKPAWEVNVGN